MSHVETDARHVPVTDLPPLPIGYFDEAGAMVDTSTLDDPREVFCRCYNALETGRTARPILATAGPLPADGADADAAASKGNLSAALPDALALAELPGVVVSFDYWSHEVGGFEPRIVVVEAVEDAGRLIVGEDLIRGGRRKFRTALIRDLTIEARDESHAVLWVDGDGQPVGMLADGISSATARAVEATANRFLASAGSEGRWAKVVPMDGDDYAAAVEGLRWTAAGEAPVSAG